MSFRCRNGRFGGFDAGNVLEPKAQYFVEERSIASADVKKAVQIWQRPAELAHVCGVSAAGIIRFPTAIEISLPVCAGERIR
jgi:hypothetical protein